MTEIELSVLSRMIAVLPPGGGAGKMSLGFGDDIFIEMLGRMTLSRPLPSHYRERLMQIAWRNKHLFAPELAAVIALAGGVE